MMKHTVMKLARDLKVGDIIRFLDATHSVEVTETTFKNTRSGERVYLYVKVLTPSFGSPSGFGTSLSFDDTIEVEK